MTALPIVYRGFLTAELLNLIDKPTGEVKGITNASPEMVAALKALMREFQISPDAEARLTRNNCGVTR